jgi:hypothetical protein
MDLIQPAQIAFAGLLQCVVHADACIRAQHVDRTEMLEHSIASTLDAVALRHVAVHRQRLGSAGTKFSRYLLGRDELDVGDHYLAAAPGNLNAQSLPMPLAPPLMKTLRFWGLLIVLCLCGE